MLFKIHTYSSTGNPVLYLFVIFLANFVCFESSTQRGSHPCGTSSSKAASLDCSWGLDHRFWTSCFPSVRIFLCFDPSIWCLLSRPSGKRRPLCCVVLRCLPSCHVLQYLRSVADIEEYIYGQRRYAKIPKRWTREDSFIVHDGHVPTRKGQYVPEFS